MKRLAPALFVLAACSSPPPPPDTRPEPPSPTTKWARARDDLNNANLTFIKASRDNRLTNAERVQYGEMLQAARNALTKAEALLPEGGEQFESYLAIAAGVLAKVRQFPTLKGE